uniref:RING-type domain-containing protein n=1 Tax=Amphimedon queenslandica TaxID=400682 RepID=A0A1X7UGD1_AMPQE
MATKPSSSSSLGLLKLEEQLTCPVCLDHYTNPKTLPCHHSFCEHCLEGLPLDKKNETYYLSCPTCRHCTELPEEGAGAFPLAFHINNLKEIYSLMKKVADPQQVTCDNCTTANSTANCKDCSKFFCTECDGIHKQWGPTSSHQLTSLDEVTASDISSIPQLLAQHVPSLVACQKRPSLSKLCKANTARSFSLPWPHPLK